MATNRHTYIEWNRIMKRAILCVGAESTGTRLMCRIFNQAGFYGKESGNYFDAHLPVEKDKLVWHRTYPRDGYGQGARTWVEISKMVSPLKKAGFDVRAVVMSRDWHSIIQSQLRVKHTRSYDESWQRLQKAYPMIFQGLSEHNIQFVVVNYESLMIYGKPVIDNTMRMLDIEPPEIIETLKDGNKKYYSQDGSK